MKAITIAIGFQEKNTQQSHFDPSFLSNYCGYITIGMKHADIFHGLQKSQGKSSTSTQGNQTFQNLYFVCL